MTQLSPGVAAEALPAATRRMIRTADAVPDAAYGEPTRLPGWTRGHVLAHLALNAEGLAAALRGLIESRRVPVYGSDESRHEDVEQLAAASPTIIRTRLLGACTDLQDALDAVPADAAGTTIDLSPGGRTFTVAEVPGTRWSEVEIHHADLDSGYDRHAWPPEFPPYLLETMRTRISATTGFTALATDLGRSWEYGVGGPVVSGAAADLAWWLTGRGMGEGLTSRGGDLPQIGGW